MSDTIIDIIVQPEPIYIEVINPDTPAVIEVVVYQGIPGPSGGGSSVSELSLIVETDGQIQFNIFVMPEPQQITELDINGVDYFENESYEFVEDGLNIKLLWLNEFPLTTTDKLKFRKY